MNARISRFLRKWSAVTGKDYRKVKKAWNGVPRNRRANMRARLSLELE